MGDMKIGCQRKNHKLFIESLLFSMIREPSLELEALAGWAQDAAPSRGQPLAAVCYDSYCLKLTCFSFPTNFLAGSKYL